MLFNVLCCYRGVRVFPPLNGVGGVSFTLDCVKSDACRESLLVESLGRRLDKPLGGVGLGSSSNKGLTDVMDRGSTLMSDIRSFLLEQLKFSLETTLHSPVITLFRDFFTVVEGLQVSLTLVLWDDSFL